MEKNCEGFLYWSLSTIFDVDYFQIDLRRLFVAEKVFCRLPFPSIDFLSMGVDGEQSRNGRSAAEMFGMSCSCAGGTHVILVNWARPKRLEYYEFGLYV